MSHVDQPVPAERSIGLLSRLLLVLGLIASISAVSVVASQQSAGAAAQWNDGSIAYSTITNCASIIQGFPYNEYGVGVYTGSLGNSATSEPYPGEVYYVHLVVYGLGNACSGQRARVEFTPPANTVPAISASNKVYCFADGVSDPSECPQTLSAGGFGGAYWIPSPDTAHARTWPLPTGHSWEFQIPVMTSVSTSNGTMRGYVAMADGNSNPTLQPTSFVGVYAHAPVLSAQTTTTQGGVNWPTSLQTTTSLSPYGIAGAAYFELRSSGGAVIATDGPSNIGAGVTGTIGVTEDWVIAGHPLTASTTYKFVLKYVTSGGTYTGPEQTFTTPPTSGGTSTSAATTTTTTMPAVPGGSGTPGQGTTPSTTPASTTPPTSTTTTVPGTTTPGPSAAEYVPLVPARLLDTRTDPSASTIDALGLGHGLVAGGETIELVVANRAGVPSTATTAVLNVTVTGAAGNGFVTVYPCGSAQPTTSNLNFTAGDTIPNAVIAKIGVGGKVCLYTNVGTHLIADINGYFPAGSSYSPLVPGRVLDTRTDPSASTVDGAGLGHGLVAGGETLVLAVGGRSGVPANASAAVLNVTVTGATGNGFATVYPCGSIRPTTSNLNFIAGQTIPNAVIAKLGDGGAVCLYTNVGTHLIADVNGYFPSGSTYAPIVPGRLLDSRQTPDATTIDGQGLGHGVVAAGDTIQVTVAGRGGVPATASAGVLNVTVTGAAGNGFVTVYPCGSDRPTTSNLNFSAGQTIPNAVISKLGAGGAVCLYTNVGTHLIVDVNGYFPG